VQYSEKNLGPHSKRLLNNYLSHRTPLKAVVNEDLGRTTYQMIISSFKKCRFLLPRICKT